MLAATTAIEFASIDSGQTIADRSLVPVGDRFEPNETRQTATNLGTISGTFGVADLSIDAFLSNDADFFRFTTTATGTSAHYVDVLFTHSAGDLDARLLDASGNVLSNSNGTSNNERLSLQGRPAGTYFLHVYGYSGARNSYRLAFQAPGSPAMPSDRYEANDTRQTATNLQTVSGIVTVSDLSIHTTSDRDFYQFVTTGPGTSAHYVDVLFSHAAGDVDARLLDASGNVLTSSTGTSDSERLSLQGRPAGTYFVEVYGYSGARNTYRLTFQAPAAPTIPGDRYETNDTRQTATNLQAVAGSVNVADLSIHTSNDRDFFAFVTAAPGTSAHFVDVLFTHTAGDIDARLLDASGNVLTSSTGTSDSERLSLQGRPAGTYYLEVYGYSGARNAYRLAFQAPPAPVAAGDRYETNDTRQTATNLGSVSGARAIADLSIHTTGDRDFFKFVTTGPGTSAHFVDVLFSHAAGDIDARLLDASGNVLTSSTGTSDSERLNLQGRPAGTYFLEVYGYSGARNAYRLAFQTPLAPTGNPGDRYETNDTRQTATDLRTVSGTVGIADLSIHTTSDRDFFTFVTTGPGTSAHFVDVLFAHAAGDIDARLLDASGNVLTSSTGTSDSERLSLQGRPAGTYFLEVYGYAGARNAYRLAFQTPLPPSGTSGDRYEANDTRQTATDLRTVSGAVSVADLSIHTTGDRDFYTFVTTGPGTSAHYVDVLFAHAAGDVDARLLDASGNVLASSAGTSDSERLSLQGRPAGTYFLEVYGYAGARNTYRLAFQAPGAPAADRYEPNDTRQTATDLRTISGSLSVADLSITATDRDFFKFTLAATGTSTHSVTASFAHAAGNLDMRLLDAQGTVLDSSTGTADNERINLDGRAAGVYFLEVFGATSGVANSYQLAFATPVASQPGGPTTDAWTIMVYLTADDLQYFAHKDINEMERAVARLPGTVNLSVFWDQSSARTTYPTGGGTQAAWGTAGRGFIVADSNMNSVATTFEILPEANTGNPQTLVDFVTWSVQRAPAERYAVILWDHGAGLEGFNFDYSDSGSSRDNLTTPELTQALTALRGNGISIDLLSFDACLMGMTEVGYATRDLTKTFVASQEIEGGDGHDYTTLFRVLESDPYAVTPAALATGFVRSYGDQYLNSSWAQQGADTHSAVLSSRYDAVVSALRSFTTAAARATASDRTAMATARSATPSYTQPYLRDLGGFMQRIANTSSISVGIRTAATGVVNAVAQAVISKTADRRGSSGMSIYLPQLGSTIASWYSTQYAAFDAATGWSAFLSGASGAGRNAAVDWSGTTNNLAARAYDLGLVTGGGLTFDNLSLLGGTDRDWFRFSIGESGVAGNRIVAQPVGTAGSVAVELYDVAGTTRLATGSAGQISLANLPAGQYALRVTSASIIDRYRLTFDAPGVDSQTAVSNSTLDKAFELGVIAGQQQFTGFVSLIDGGGTVSGGWSFYTFEAAPSVGQQTINLEIATPEGVSLDAEILDGSGQVLRSSSGTGIVSLSLPAVGSGDGYVLRVRQTPTRTATTAAAFSAVFNVATASVAEDIALSATVIPENRPAGWVIGTLAAAIPGSSGGFTYELVAGEGATDNTAFGISDNQLTAARPFNFELRRTYSVRIRATDGSGQSTERSFTITVTNIVNEPLVVESITPPPSATYIAGQRVTFTAALSRQVAVRGQPRIEVRAGNVVRWATYVAGSGSAVLTFQYVVGTADSFDSVSLGQRFLFPAGSGIFAGAVSLAPRLPSPFAGAVSPGVRIDGRPPRVIERVSVPAAGTYGTGQSLEFVAQFSEPVVVTGSVAPRIALRGLNVPRWATYVSGSGTTNLTFRYVVGQGDAIVRQAGLGLGTSIVLPTGARITDAAGNRGLLGITAAVMNQVRIDARVMASLASSQSDEGRTPRSGRIGALGFARLG